MGSGQFELVGPYGTRILTDVHKPSLLTAPATAKDILLTIHNHPDHIYEEFLDNFPGQQLYIRTGEVQTEHVFIKGIPSAHTSYSHEEYLAEGGSNYIFLIKIGGLRIAHLGDIGQEELTPEQLEVLGEVDIALMQFFNSFSQMDVRNQKGFKLMAQLKPRLIFPTHGGSRTDVIEQALSLWQVYAAGTESLTIRPADIPTDTQMVILGSNVDSLQTLFNLPVWSGK